jgi:hypothetical protein
MFDSNRAKRFEAVPSSREELQAEIDSSSDNRERNFEDKPIPSLKDRLLEISKISSRSLHHLEVFVAGSFRGEHKVGEQEDTIMKFQGIALFQC